MQMVDGRKEKTEKKENFGKDNVECWVNGKIDGRKMWTEGKSKERKKERKKEIEILRIIGEKERLRKSMKEKKNNSRERKKKTNQKKKKKKKNQTRFKRVHSVHICESANIGSMYHNVRFLQDCACTQQQQQQQ